MILANFLLLSKENQLQVIRLRGTLCHSRKDYNFEYELYAVEGFYVEVCKCASSMEQQNIRCFNNKAEVNQFVAKVGVENIF